MEKKTRKKYTYAQNGQEKNVYRVERYSDRLNKPQERIKNYHTRTA